ncbi:MAG TPA: hypothetical protein VGY57_03895 [Vicinamibacterales bacterium]|nr:hypothetical protein [Vicinamibacterales bacterium]
MIIDSLWWTAALVVCAAPRRIWDRIDPRFPLRRAATAAGFLTLVVGFFFGFDQFLTFSRVLADTSNTWMLKRAANDASAPIAVYGLSAATFIIFLFFTPAGLLSMYLVISGAARAISAVVDDPRGDPLISIVYWTATTLWTRNRNDRQKISRERQEGADAPDVLRTGEWAELHGVDYVVLAARRKPEWNAGAIILTATDWYKLGVPFDMDTPAGLRTAYPLTKMETVEVVRRGIQYELPRLLPSAAKTRKHETA